MESKPIAWERMRDESAQAYAAFCLYRDMGSARSLDRAYALHVERVNAEGGRQLSVNRVSGRWNEWCQENVWVERVAAYDLDCERRRRQQAEREREAQYTQELEEYRARQKQMAIAAQRAALTLMDLSSRRLNKILVAVNAGAAPGASPAQLAAAELALNEIPVKALPNFFRAVAAMAEAGTNAEAQALGLMELMKALDGSDTSDNQ